MGEIFDVVDEYGLPTGETIERKLAHATGTRHRTAHVWIVRRTRDGFDILLQKRAEGKDSFPGCYDTSAAGHIQAGDEPLESALRELEEELGIKAVKTDLTFAGTFRIYYKSTFYGEVFHDSEIAFVFVYEQPVEVSGLALQKEEVDSVEWFDLEETIRKCRDNDRRFCVPVDGLETLKRYLSGRECRRGS